MTFVRKKDNEHYTINDNNVNNYCFLYWPNNSAFVLIARRVGCRLITSIINIVLHILMWNVRCASKHLHLVQVLWLIRLHERGAGIFVAYSVRQSVCTFDLQASLHDAGRLGQRTGACGVHIRRDTTSRCLSDDVTSVRRSNAPSGIYSEQRALNTDNK